MNENTLIAMIQSMPLALVLIAAVFYRDIRGLLSNIYVSSLTIAGLTLEVDSKTTKELAGFLVDAMNSSVTIEEWGVFSKIVASINDPKRSTISQILGWKLNRDEAGNVKDATTKKNLKMLRALRGFGLISPSNEKDRWRDDSVVVVTEFGKYVAKHPKLKRLIKNG
jgi:hypothetical protein